MNSISATIERALSAAGLDVRAPALAKATATIRHALAAAGLGSAAPGWARRMVDPASADVSPFPGSERDTDAHADASGRFTTRSHTIGTNRRDYKLYVPASAGDRPMPLIVMLHGCRQDPDDFARGTRMNELAERHGFLVAYPAQTARANGANCWNWFEAGEQSREGIEASLIAGIVAEIGTLHPVDPRRVFVAGLSAGAAMAVILGAMYPERFTAVGVHSGLPLGTAHDVGSAFAAMRGAGAPASAKHPARGVPTIVFHGDADTTVAPVNGTAVVRQVREAFEADPRTPLVKTTSPREALAGRALTRTRYLDDAGRARIEHWVLHGAPHAWSGGSAAGSFTDPAGPDASAEFVRFFLAQ